MKLTKTKLEGVVVLEPDVFGDNRGFFMESWSQKKWKSLVCTTISCKTIILRVL